jgi:putative protease
LHGTSTPAVVHELADAGADELFLGYAPPYWTAELGFEVSPNRRYRRENQVTSPQQLRALVEAAVARKRPVALAFNEHVVSDRMLELGRRLVEEALAAGVSAVIVADPTVVLELRRDLPDLAIHFSGDAGVYNAAGCELAFRLGARRVILPREIPFADLAAAVCRARGPDREFEAFVMGEPCVFDGARCFTEHGYGFGSDFCNYHSLKEVVRRGEERGNPLPPALPHGALDEAAAARLSLGRCGLCAIPELARAGVTHLKIPGRASDVLEATRLARRMLDDPAADAGVARSLLAAPRLCESTAFCYFPEVTGG